jgi:uncharacterized protein YndB with AHSA1/START domain
VPERGCLLIADIGGYTKFLTAVELEHSTDILADLIGAIVAQAQGAFRLAKLEGDAVFCYAPDGALDGPAFVTLVESCYFAFAERLRDISRASSCDCGACRLTPSLNLKFVAHAGEYVRHEVAGNIELLGPDVITVHRLLKNYVVEKTGHRGYAFLSGDCVTHFGLDPEAYGLIAHTEHYDDVGDIPGYVLDVEAAWTAHQAEQRVFVTPEESMFQTRRKLAAPPAVVWDYLNSPAKGREWFADDVIDRSPDRKRGIGSSNHCVHGKSATFRQILDWKPFRYYTESNVAGPVRMSLTWELTPTDDGKTVLEMRARPEGNAAMRWLVRRVAPAKIEAGLKAIEKLERLLAADPAASVAPVPSAQELRTGVNAGVGQRQPDPAP